MKDFYSHKNHPPFGSYLAGSDRKTTETTYDYGFNGKRKDPEMYNVSGSSYDFGARIYDPRIGRWWAIDPKFKNQPSWSPYKAHLNNPIINIDVKGETEYQINIIHDEKSGKTVLKIKTANIIMTDGIVHDVNWGLSETRQNYYYDFATITVTTVHTDGSMTVNRSAPQLIKENGVKDSDFIWGSSAIPGWPKVENTWTTNPDHGQEVSFGIAMTGKGTGPVAQDWSKNAIGSIDFGDLQDMLGRSSIAKGYSPGSNSWKKMSNADANDWIEFVKNRKEEGEKVGELFNETKKYFTDDSTKFKKEFNDGSSKYYKGGKNNYSDTSSKAAREISEEEFHNR